jgi:hypothetical protein
MNASGGSAAPLNNASEQFRVSEPKTSSSNSNNETLSSNAGQSQQKPSGTEQSSSSSQQRDPRLQDKAARQKKMNEEDLQHAGVSRAVTGNNAGVDDAKRSSQRAPKDVGAQDDVEMLHGKTTLGDNDKGDQGKGGNDGKKSGEESGKSSSGGKQSSGQSGKSSSGEKQDSEQSGKSSSGGKQVEMSEFDDEMRHKAAKFVNIEE